VLSSHANKNTADKKPADKNPADKNPANQYPFQRDEANPQRAAIKSSMKLNAP